MLERMRGRPTALLVGAVLGTGCGALGGCTDLEPAIMQSSIRGDTPRLDKEIQEWLGKLPPEDRALIEKEIRWRADLLIHVMEGILDEADSRGGASSLASSDFSKQRCKRHPKAAGVPWSQDWNVFIDRRLAEKWAKEKGIPSPPDATLHHEIRGHILLMLQNPEYMEIFKRGDQKEIKKLKEDLEEKVRPMENQYRRHNGLKEVPKYLPESTKQ